MIECGSVATLAIYYLTVYKHVIVLDMLHPCFVFIVKSLLPILDLSTYYDVFSTLLAAPPVARLPWILCSTG